MDARLFLVLLSSILFATASVAAPKIVTSPDQPIDFEVPSYTHVAPRRAAEPAPQAQAASPAPVATPCTAESEGLTRYNNTPAVKGIEVCDGARWVGLMKTAPQADAPPTAKCAATDESLIRYNRGKDIKAYEYCDGANWRALGPSLKPPISTIIDKPFVQDAKTPGLLASGTFAEDGYIGGFLSCNGGTNLLSLYLTIGHDPSPGAVADKIVSATAQNNSPGHNDISQTSFFSFVPKDTPWKVWARDNWGNGHMNKANCAVKLTRFGN